MTGLYSPAQLRDFQQRLAVGAHWQQKFARWLESWGIPVEHVSQPHLGGRDEIQRFTEAETDVIANGFRLELKSSSRSFLLPGDFPFPDVALESVSGFHAKRHKPDLYVVLSQPTGSGLVVPTSTQNEWVIRPLHDPKRGTTVRAYFAPKDVCRPLWRILDLLAS